MNGPTMKQPMTPERIAELRALEGVVFSMPQDHDYVDQTDTWQDMLDEIDRLQAENVRVRTYAQTMDKLHEVRLIEISTPTSANAILTEGWKPWIMPSRGET